MFLPTLISLPPNYVNGRCEDEEEEEEQEEKEEEEEEEEEEVVVEVEEEEAATDSINHDFSTTGEARTGCMLENQPKVAQRTSFV